MKQPIMILPPGTKVRTYKRLGKTDGMMISPNNLNLRKPNTVGEVSDWVPGHGGDVYWVQHEGDDRPAAYCFTELSLLEPVKVLKAQLRLALDASHKANRELQDIKTRKPNPALDDGSQFLGVGESAPEDQIIGGLDHYGSLGND
jgi:hypothetical protein